MSGDRKAQSAVWGFLLMLVFIALAGGLVDFYRLYAARNWAYAVAQEAALAGASQGRDWNSLAADGRLGLDATRAEEAAGTVVAEQMASRSITTYTLEVRVLSGADGGSIAGFPPTPVRLGSGMGDWSSTEPAVGVYLEVPVDWVLLDMLDTPLKTVRVFSAAGVAQ